MTDQQIARFRRLLADSISARAEKDPEKHVFLRGWNGGLKHAEEMFDKARTDEPASL